MNCETNINSDYNNILFKLGFLNKDSPTLISDRRKLYLSACIPTRFSIAMIFGLLYFVDNDNFHYYLSIVSMLISLLAILHLSFKDKKYKLCQWWSNNFQLYISLAIFFGSLILLLTSKYKITSVFIMSMLLISVIGGIYQFPNLK